MKLKPVRFICEPVVVHYSAPPMLEKKPSCPDGFTWRELYYPIVESISEWVDYQRKGRMARNMRPTHAATASQRGSWGVSQFYFRVMTADERIFDIYYDRSPKDASDRKGSWFLDKELAEQ